MNKENFIIIIIIIAIFFAAFGCASYKASSINIKNISIITKNY